MWNAGEKIVLIGWKVKDGQFFWGCVMIGRYGRTARASFFMRTFSNESRSQINWVFAGIPIDWGLLSMAFPLAFWGRTDRTSVPVKWEIRRETVSSELQNLRTSEHLFFALRMESVSSVKSCCLFVSTDYGNLRVFVCTQKARKAQNCDLLHSRSVRMKTFCEFCGFCVRYYFLVSREGAKGAKIFINVITGIKLFFLVILAIRGEG